MEREPDYGQYWQPEGQPAEGYYGQQQPGYGQVDYSQSGYASDPYQQDPYQQDPNQDPTRDPQDPTPSQDQYGQQNYQQPYGFTGYEYAEHRPYAPTGPGDSGADESVESTAQWSTTDLITDPTPAPGLSGPGPEGRPEPPAPAEQSASGSSALGAGAAGGRASRRAAARGRTGPQPSGDTRAPAESPLARLVAAATGRTPGTDRKTYLRRVGIGAAALVVLAGAGYTVAGGGSGSGSTSADSTGTAPAVSLTSGHTKIWAAPADAGSANDNDGLVGSWILPTAVVRGDGTGVTAYSTSNGSKLWTLIPPSPGAVPCGMSPTISTSGIGAVLFQAKAGTGQACTQLVAVDSATGTQKWTAKISGSGGASVMVDDTTAAAVGGSGAVGYNLATGKQSWTYTGPGKYCTLGGSGTAGTLLLQSTCADTSPKQQAIALNTDTGKLNWWRGLPATAASYTVLSADPAVVSVHMTDSSQDTLLSFTATGGPQATIPVAQVGGTLDSVHGSFDPVPALFFQGDTMVAELSPTDAAGATGGSTPGASASGAVTAFSLATGKQLWQTAPLEKGHSALVGLDSSGVVIATEEQIGQPARLSHFDLTTGKEAAGGSFPQGTGSLLTSGRVFYQGSLVVALPEFTSTYSTAATAFTVAAGQ
jgi:hypothetical protein